MSKNITTTSELPLDLRNLFEADFEFEVKSTGTKNKKKLRKLAHDICKRRGIELEQKDET